MNNSVTLKEYFINLISYPLLSFERRDIKFEILHFHPIKKKIPRGIFEKLTDEKVMGVDMFENMRKKTNFCRLKSKPM